MRTYLITLAAVLTWQLLWFIFGRWAIKTMPTCASCGAMFFKKADLLGHIATCPKHPLKQEEPNEQE